MSRNLKTPTSSRFKVLLFALLPYAYVFVVLAVVFAIFGLLLWTVVSGAPLNGAVARIEMVLAAIAALFLRAIWVRVAKPEGVTLRQDEAPELFSMVRGIARKLGGPSVRGIQLVDEYKVSAVPVPGLSLFSWPVRHYLQIGLPLMHALSPEQFNATIAQLLGGFSGAGDRFGGWVKVRTYTWHYLLAALVRDGGWARWSFSRFFNWYVPRFHMGAIFVTRQHEFAADQAASKVTSAEVTADALIRTAYGTYLEDRFWDEVDEGTARQPETGPTIAELLQNAETGVAEDWLRAALEETTHPFSAEPALKDRLVALGQSARVPAPIEKSAAEALLGDCLAEVTQRLKIKQQQRLGWGQKKFPPVTRDLDELLSRSQQPDFTEFESLELGRQLLAKNQEEGVSFLLRAMEADSELTASACFHLSNYYQRRGDLVTANRYSRRSTDHWQAVQKAFAERTQISFVEKFLIQNLSEREIERLRNELALHAEIKEAYLVRKDVKYVPEKPLHVLGLVFDHPWIGKTADDLPFTKTLPHTTTYPPLLYPIILDYRNRRVSKLIRSVNNSLIYQRT